MNWYAGIGSRETPDPILACMRRFAAEMAEQGWGLTSGGADGADKAFEAGCDLKAGQKQIYLPWRGFNRNGSRLHTQSQMANESVCQFHPNPSALKEVGFKLMARNYHQVMRDGDRVKFVICWTPDGKASGGTGQAMRIADHYSIPIFNLRCTTTTDVLDQVLIAKRWG